MRYPVLPVVLPSDIARATNGKLPARALKAITGGSTLHHRAAAAWEVMVQAAAADGVELRHVGAYRSHEQQVAMFRDRYQATPTGSKVTRRWNGVTYYLKPGKAPSATPGSSNHGWGLAIDIASVGSGERLPWLIANAGRFGFTWEVADPSNPNFEAWHIRYVRGDADAPAAPSAGRTLRLGDRGDDVARLQWALTDVGYLCKADGEFGPVTDQVVRAFQRDHGLTVDGIVGPRTRAALGL
jgi:LAS superfamily LD-carboxypeptidase LdcB